jgi:hypothetical protein
MPEVEQPQTGLGTLQGAPARSKRGGCINYLNTDVLAYAAKVMTLVEGHEGIRCGSLL